MVAGSVGSLFGSFAGALMGALIGGADNAAVGEHVDDTVLDTTSARSATTSSASGTFFESNPPVRTGLSYAGSLSLNEFVAALYAGVSK